MMTKAIKKITKTLIAKNTAKVFSRWGEPLIDMQKQFTDDIMWYFDAIYSKVIEEINQDIQFKVEVKKYAEEQVASLADWSENIIKTLEEGALLGMVDLDSAFVKEGQVTTALGITNQYANDRAKEHSAKLITQISDTTQKRINKLVSKAVAGDIWKVDLVQSLKTDYAFSQYRASFIASNELWTAYIRGKELQFNQYQAEYGLNGWVQWASQRDDKVTFWCEENDLAGWIQYNEAFPSWDYTAPRFPGCRCNINFRLFKPA